MDIKSIAQMVAARTGGPVYKSGAGWSVRCPCHNDSKGSLVIYHSVKYGYHPHCFKGCNTQELIKEINGIIGK